MSRLYNADGSMRPGRKLQSSGGGNSSWSSQGGWDNEAKENEPRNSVSRSQHAAVKQADGPSPVAAGMKSKSGEASFGSGQRQTQAAKYKALQGSNIFGGESDAANLQDATAKLQQVQVADGPPAGSAGQFRSADPGSRDISDTKKRALYQTNVFVNTAEAPSAAAEVQPVKEVPAEPAGSAGHFRSAEPGNREISDFKKKALYSTHVFGVEDNGPTAAPQLSQLKKHEMSGHNIFGAAEEPAPRPAAGSARRPPGGASSIVFGNGAETGTPAPAAAAAPQGNSQRRTAGGSSSFIFG